MHIRGSLRAQLVKNLPAMWKTWVSSLGWEVPLEKGKATHFSILYWRISWSRTRLRDFHFHFDMHIMVVSKMFHILSLLVLKHVTWCLKPIAISGII